MLDGRAHRPRRLRRDRRLQGGRGLPPAGRRRRPRGARPHRRRAPLRRRARPSPRWPPSRPAPRCGTRPGPDPAHPPRPGGRPRARGPGHRPGPRPLRRAGISDDLLTDTSARHPGAGGRVPRHAHRDVGAPGGAGQPGALLRRGRARRRPEVGPPGRRRRRGRAPRRAGRHRGRRADVLRRSGAERRSRPGRRSGCSSPPAAPASRSTPSGSSATAPPASRATPWPRRRAARGAEVTLVTTTARPAPAGRRGRPRSRRPRRWSDAVLARGDEADVVVMAAAVADFRPGRAADRKLKKADGVPEIVLEPTPDILAALGPAQAPRTDPRRLRGRDRRPAGQRRRQARPQGRRPHRGQRRVGRPASGFEHDTNAVVILDAAGGAVEVPLTDKRAIARSRPRRRHPAQGATT